MTRFCFFDHLLPYVDIFYLKRVFKKSTFLDYVVNKCPLIFYKYLFWFSINIYLCVCCCFAWDANVGCICLSWTCWGWGGWGWRWDCWWGWGTCWGCGTCCRTCCGCCCGCWGRCSTTTSRWISASDVLRSEIKSSCNRKSRKFCQNEEGQKCYPFKFSQSKQARKIYIFLYNHFAMNFTIISDVLRSELKNKNENY